jgi:hypothetical protein
MRASGTARAVGFETPVFDRLLSMTNMEKTLCLS